MEEAGSGAMRFASPAKSLSITGQGKTLLTINLETGEVTAPSLEDASEAGRVFVESIRGHLSTPNPASPAIR